MAVTQAPVLPPLPLQPAAFLQKWNLRFRSNDTFDISEADLREQARDLMELLGQLASRRGAPLVLTVLDELATVNQNFLVVGQGATVANATDAATAAAGFEAGELQFVLRKDSAGPLWAFVNAKPETTQRVRVRWLPVGNPAARPEFLPPLLDEDDPHAAGDAVKYTFPNGQTIPLEVRRAIPLPGAGLFNPVPTGHPTDDPNYLPLAPLLVSLPQPLSPEQILALVAEHFGSGLQVWFGGPATAKAGEQWIFPGDGIYLANADFEFDDTPQSGTGDWEPLIEVGKDTYWGSMPASRSDATTIPNYISQRLLGYAPLSVFNKRTFWLRTEPGRDYVDVMMFASKWQFADEVYIRGVNNVDYTTFKGYTLLKMDETVVLDYTNNIATLNAAIAAASLAQAEYMFRIHLPSANGKPVRAHAVFSLIGNVPNSHYLSSINASECFSLDGGGNSGGQTGPWPPLTNPVVDDVAKMFRATLPANFRSTDAEYTTDAGATWTAATDALRSGNVLSVPVSGAKAAGQVGWRMRADDGRAASGAIYNATAFTGVSAPLVWQEDNPAITYAGAWTAGNQAGFFGTGYKSTTELGATATFTVPAGFTAVSLQGHKDTGGSYFKVTRNGVQVMSSDQYEGQGGTYEYLITLPDNKLSVQAGDVIVFTRIANPAGGGVNVANYMDQITFHP